MERKSFGKSEKLKSGMVMSRLFRDGQNGFAFPIKMYYSKEESSENPVAPRVAVSVPKKKFKRAVDRNLIKRRIKEAYRLHSQNWKKEQTQNINLLFVFISPTIENYNRIEKSIKRLLTLI